VLIEKKIEKKKNREKIAVPLVETWQIVVSEAVDGDGDARPTI